ncbi:MAG: hypothetical protein RLZZ126_1062 [Pseudomonadota bacterium]|jgi:predicted aminopeptidase
MPNLLHHPWSQAPLRCAARIGVVALALGLLGCADFGYYAQSIQGHLGVMNAARPVPEWLADPSAPAPLKERLELSQRIREFASRELMLPDNASYRRYGDLQRHAVVWNVVASPPDSLTLKTWCFVVVGCVSYRGFYDEAAARSLAAELVSQGLEVSVYGVPAYSTLGWLNWLGGDPLLNTFIHYPEGELARLLFHELAHQVLYVQGDTAFNESFATAVERIGGRRWLAERASPLARTEYERFNRRREDFRKLTRSARARLQQVYACAGVAQPGFGNYSGNKLDIPVYPCDKSATKEIAYGDFRNEWRLLRHRWQSQSETEATAFERSVSGYDQWVARANNASFGAQGVYDDWVPAFEALFEQTVKAVPAGNSPWPAFYDAVKRWAALPRAERSAQLRSAAPPTP